MAPRATNPAEKRWIAGALAGDPQEFAHLIQAYQNPVYNLCYRMLGQHEDAEDATQETFLRAYTHLHQYDSNRRFLNWILTIASHLCIDRLRKKKLPTLPIDAAPAPEQARPNGISPEHIAVAREQADEIQQWLAQLPADYRTPIILLYWYGFSYEEIAHILHLSVPAVKSRLHRARKKLASLITSQPVSIPTLPTP